MSRFLSLTQLAKRSLKQGELKQVPCIARQFWDSMLNFMLRKCNLLQKENLVSSIFADIANFLRLSTATVHSASASNLLVHCLSSGQSIIHSCIRNSPPPPRMTECVSSRKARRLGLDGPFTYCRCQRFHFHSILLDLLSLDRRTDCLSLSISHRRCRPRL